MNEIITTGDRVRENTSEHMKQVIDQKTFDNVKDYFDRSDKVISHRISELDKEWDIERVLEINMSALALTGLAMSFKNRFWMALPTVAVGFFAQHALRGWCPPVELYRLLRFRTRQEIEKEKHALKALRGDYDNIKSPEEAYLAVTK